MATGAFYAAVLTTISAGPPVMPFSGRFGGARARTHTHALANFVRFVQFQRNVPHIIDVGQRLVVSQIIPVMLVNYKSMRANCEFN